MARNDNQPVLDTSRMSEGERAALEMTEAAREATAMERTFAGDCSSGATTCRKLPRFPSRRSRTGTREMRFFADWKNFSGRTPIRTRSTKVVKYPTRSSRARQIGRVRDQDSDQIRRTRPLADELLPGRGNAWKLVRQHDGPPQCSPVDWCSSTAVAFRNAGAAAKIPPQAGQRRNFGLCAHRARGRIGPRAHGNIRGTVRGRVILCSQRLQDVVHEWHPRRPYRRHGQDPARAVGRKEQRPDHGVHCRNRLAGR